MFDQNRFLPLNGGPSAYIKSVNIPIELYESMKGDYFIGYADGLIFGSGTSAWARLYNPRNSGVILHVNVWTVTDISTAPFRAQFWFNAHISGEHSESDLVTCSNTAIRPVPVPRVKLQMASSTTETPSDGVKAFVRRGEPLSTVVETENGKLIFPPAVRFSYTFLFLKVTTSPPRAESRSDGGKPESEPSAEVRIGENSSRTA